ncbi:MAG TPA: RTX toxin, partial [Sphingomonas sp.]
GADRFQFASRLDLGDGASAPDRIADFRRADRDRIDLALVDADEAAAGDQAFRFVGAAAFTGVAGELRAERVGDVTRVSGDVDGDAVADFVFEAAGAPPLAQVDFIL